MRSVASFGMVALLAATACSSRETGPEGASANPPPADPPAAPSSDAGLTDITDGDAGATPPLTPQTPAAITAACEASIDAVESWRKRCGAVGFSAFDRPTALAQCERTFQAPGVSGGLGTCTTKFLATASCALSELATLAVACPPTPGTRPDGASCAFRAQCAGTCKFGPEKDGKEPACGTCAPLGSGGAGASCDDPADCSAGLACFLGKCTKGKAEGATCNDAFDVCDAGLVCLSGSSQCGKARKLNESCGGAFECDLDLRCAVGTCKAKAVAGETCTSVLDCAQGLGCDRATNKCSAFVFAGQGATCDFGFDFKGVNLCAAGPCQSTFGSSSSKCPTVLAVGAPCGGNVVGECAGESKCLDGTCALYDATVCK